MTDPCDPYDPARGTYTDPDGIVHREDRATIPPPANPTFRLTRQGVDKLAAYRVPPPLPYGTEADCRCGATVDVPPGEDPNDAVCPECAADPER